MRGAVILVEGISDRIALETLAVCRGSAGIDVRAIGGAQAIRAVLAGLTADVHATGLCDEREAPLWEQAFRAAGRPAAFEVCRADLEDELIRALGAGRIEEVLAEHRDLAAFRTFQKQPAWRGRPVEAQLRRFFGSADRRKSRYARHLVEAAAGAGCVPAPLDAVLATG